MFYSICHLCFLKLLNRSPHVTDDSYMNQWKIKTLSKKSTEIFSLKYFKHKC